MAALKVISIIIMAIGMVGMVYPVFPGTFVVFLGPLLYVIFDGFKTISVTVFIIMAVLTLLGMFIDNIAGLLGTKKFGASKKGVLGALIGGTAGLLLFNLPGFLIGQFLGVVVVEVLYGMRFKKSLIAGVGVFIGYILGYLGKLILGGAILVLFIIRIW
jgi:uncharacterized protein YqgC (DUF456 family)